MLSWNIREKSFHDTMWTTDSMNFLFRLETNEVFVGSFIWYIRYTVYRTYQTYYGVCLRFRRDQPIASRSSWCNKFHEILHMDYRLNLAFYLCNSITTNIGALHKHSILIEFPKFSCFRIPVQFVKLPCQFWGNSRILLQCRICKSHQIEPINLVSFLVCNKWLT